MTSTKMENDDLRSGIMPSTVCVCGSYNVSRVTESELAEDLYSLLCVGVSAEQ